MTRWLWLSVAIAACGSSSPAKSDAPANKDSAAAKVQVVTCPATPAASITTSNFAFTPASVTISQGQVVQIMTESIHNVAPGHSPADSTISDPGLTAGLGATTCFMFTQAGSYGYHCAVHPSMNGTVVVQ